MEQPPPFKTKGDPQLLEEPLTAFFCSAHCPGGLILKTYDLACSMRDAGVAIMGGFQTPMEKECQRLLLRGSQPVVICPACCIENMRVPRDWRGPLKEGRLLILSPFPATVSRPTAESAAKRNELVADIARQVFTNTLRLEVRLKTSPARSPLLASLWSPSISLPTRT